MTSLFSEERVNSGRQIEFDLAKCLSLVFMILLHCLMVTGGFNNNISGFLQKGIGQLVGEPYAAPVFMFAMGIGMVYSRNQEPIYLIKRGIYTMFLGVIVNFGEFILPHFLAGKLLGEWEIFPIAGGLLLFCIDILAFAGMAMITIGLFKMLKLSAKQMVVIALVMSVAGSFLRFTDLGSNVANLIAGYFIGSAGGFTAFPLFNWIIFPVMGFFCGDYYIRCNDKKKLLRFWPIAVVISTAYFVASWYIPNGFLSEVHHYYFITTLDALFCLIYIYGNTGFCHAVSGSLSDGAKRFISKMSSCLNEIYIVQWFLIPLTYIFITYFKRDIVFGNISLFIIAALELAAATAIAFAYKGKKKRS